jgi:hypothetical protein
MIKRATFDVQPYLADSLETMLPVVISIKGIWMSGQI